MTEAATAAATRARGYATLLPGDTAPWFKQRSGGNPTYVFDTAAGRYLVLCFFMSTSDPVGAAAVRSAIENRDIFDDVSACFFGVSLDPADEREGRVRDSMPGLRFFWDFDGLVSRLYGAAPEGPPEGKFAARRFWMVLDPTMRVMAVFPMRSDAGEVSPVFAYLRSLPPPPLHAGFEIPAPILVLPNVFEQEFCRRLVGLYDAAGGEESGFMREVDGKTVLISDHSHKRRRDHVIEDPATITALQSRIIRRVNPQIERIFAFMPTRMERYIIGCYAAEDAAHFRPHRDNTTKGTAHRRFAVSINLNDDFDGGEVSFPEYGTRSYKAPPGGAVIFPCALLHAVSRVTHGRRYAFLPFLYDEAAAKIREANNQFLEGAASYRADPAAPEPGG